MAVGAIQVHTDTLWLASRAMRILRANTNAVLTVVALAGQVTVREGQTYDVDAHEWAETFQEHPWVFDTGQPVEQATAAPGEKRSTRRAPAKKK